MSKHQDCPACPPSPFTQVFPPQPNPAAAHPTHVALSCLPRPRGATRQCSAHPESPLSCAQSTPPAPPSPSFSRPAPDPLHPAESSARERRGTGGIPRSPASAASARGPSPRAPAAAARLPPTSPPLAGSSPQSSAQEPKRNRCRANGASRLAGRGSGAQKSNKPVAAVDPLTEAAYRRPRPTALPSAEQKSLALGAARRPHRAGATTLRTAVWDSESVPDYKTRSAARVLRRHAEFARVSGSFSFLHKRRSEF